MFRSVNFIQGKASKILASRSVFDLLEEGLKKGSGSVWIQWSTLILVLEGGKSP